MARVDVNAPIDQLHALSIWLIESIRADVERAREEVAAWEPRPCPEGVYFVPHCTVR